MRPRHGTGAGWKLRSESKHTMAALYVDVSLFMGAPKPPLSFLFILFWGGPKTKLLFVLFVGRRSSPRVCPQAVSAKRCLSVRPTFS